MKVLNYIVRELSDKEVRNLHFTAISSMILFFSIIAFDVIGKDLNTVNGTFLFFSFYFAVICEIAVWRVKRGLNV